VVNEELFEVMRVLRAWATKEPFVRRLWVFGSRLRGTQRTDSDLDVALEIDPVGNDEIPLTSWLSGAAQWRAELQARLPYVLDLQLYDATGHQSNVVQYVNCCGALVYDRANNRDSMRTPGNRS
jgi:uncharacterized protein